MNILFISLGCDKNRVDTEYMIGSLTEANFQLTAQEEMADIIVVNTCCFIDDAKEESIQQILEVAEYKIKGRCKALIVAGCMAERYKSEILKEIPEVDACIGTGSTDKILEAVTSVLEGKKYEAYTKSQEQLHIDTKRVISTGGHYAHLKIAEGCDKNCTYCIIPKLRGHYRSVPMEELLTAANHLVAQGVKELILVAQETTLYGIDLYHKKALPELLDQLNQIPDLMWIRLMYCYPEEIDQPLLDAIKRNHKVCHYLDMPIQHGNSDILKRMGRRTNHTELSEKINMIRRTLPDVALRTTLICGFPGETQKQHEDMMYFINEHEFDRLGAFAYSKEEDTPAASFDEQIEDSLKQDWVAEAMELQEKIISDKNQDMIGSEMMVMIEGKVADENAYIARSYRDAPDIDGYVFIHTTRQLVTGDFVEVKITGAYEYDLIGEVL